MLAIHTLWGAPVLIVIILGLLYQQLGWATFVGLVVVAIYSPISSEYNCHAHRELRAAVVQNKLATHVDIKHGGILLWFITS